MRLLVVGGSGLVGSNVVREGLDRGWDVTATYHTDQPAIGCPLDRVDIRDADAFRSVFDTRHPDLVVNCAALTDVDACERTPERAAEVNGVAPRRLAAACRSRGTGFVNLSTDYVFDGSANRPYTEDDDPRPIQRYGATKYLGERKVRAAHPDALIARLSFVYGTRGDNGTLDGFPAWIRGQLADPDPASVPVFSDQFVTPTRAGAAAETLCDLADAGATGLFHVASRSCVTPYEFGRTLCERWDVDPAPLERVSTDSLDRPADRPRYSCLDVSKVATRLERPQPTVDEDIAAMAAARRP